MNKETNKHRNTEIAKLKTNKPINKEGRNKQMNKETKKQTHKAT